MVHVVFITTISWSEDDGFVMLTIIQNLFTHHILDCKEQDQCYHGLSFQVLYIKNVIVNKNTN